jgi:hypothetical protein
MGKKWCYVKMGRDELGHITTYDAGELSKFGVFYVITGTFLGEHFVWKQSALLIGIQFGVVFLCKYAFKGNEALIPANIATPVATVMNGLVGFLLSMYVSDALARWWTVREKMLGGLVAGIDMINMALARRHRSGSDYDEWLIEQYGRMSLAVHELIYIQAERDLHHDLEADGDHDLTILVERNFLLEEVRPVPPRARAPCAAVPCVTLRCVLHGIVPHRKLISSKAWTTRPWWYGRGAAHSSPTTPSSPSRKPSRQWKPSCEGGKQSRCVVIAVLSDNPGVCLLTASPSRAFSPTSIPCCRWPTST